MRIKIELTQEEALNIVGSLKFCSSMDSGVDKLDKIADRITRAHLEALKEETKLNQ